MPGGVDYYPSRDEALAYLADYEDRYALPVERPVTVTAVHREALADAADAPSDGLRVAAADGRQWLARAVISATGTYGEPVVPEVPGRATFRGEQVHSSSYAGPTPYAGRRVLVVGGGNSGAQILAEASLVADTIWSTLLPPTFLADDIDGRYLFEQETLRYHARLAGAPEPPAASLGSIVMVEPVRDARARGVLRARGPIARLTADEAVWPDGTRERIDAIVWCTGFRPALKHLTPLGITRADGRVDVAGTRSVQVPRLWLLGYGEWTGFASATLIGVGRSARATVEQVTDVLSAGGGRPRA